MFMVLMLHKRLTNHHQFPLSFQLSIVSLLLPSSLTFLESALLFPL